VSYLRCAPSKASGLATGLLNLFLRIRNDGPRPVTVNKIVLRIGGALSAVKTLDVDFTVGAAAAVSWVQPEDFVFTPLRGLSLRIEISAAGFSEPDVTTSPLVAHENPTANNSYRFWAETRDLRAGEFWHVHGFSHAQTKEQSFAYDVGVNVVGGNGLLPGKDGTAVTHYRVWGKPIHAIAAGTVRHARNDFPTNETFGDVSPEIQELINSLGDGNGNFVTIATGDETVLYAHLQPGTVAVAPGDAVEAGDFLGLAGHSGAASHPHLHIGAVRTNAGPQSWADHGRPMRFHHAHAVAWAEITGKTADAPWVNVDGRGLPTADCAVWPSDRAPLRFPDIEEEVAIDPLALLLRHDVYVKLTLPDPPPPEVLREQVRRLARQMSPAERRRVAKSLNEFAASVEILKKELGG
jgi:hypothetical protein